MAASTPQEDNTLLAGVDPIASTKDRAGAAGEMLKNDAADVAAAAKAAAQKKVEENKGVAAQMAEDFAAALRKAGDELGARDRGPVAEFTQKAAARVSDFAQHVSDKRPPELVDELRSFGRENPLAFAGAAAVAGLAIGRLLRGSIEPMLDEADAQTTTPGESAGVEEPLP